MLVDAYLGGLPAAAVEQGTAVAAVVLVDAAPTAGQRESSGRGSSSTKKLYFTKNIYL